MKLPEAIKPAKSPILDLPKASSLSLMAKPTTFAGRKLGLLVANGAGADIFNYVIYEIDKLKATVEVIAPQIGNISLSDNSKVKVDHFIGAAPSVLFDAVVLLIPNDTDIDLSLKPKIADFVTDAINHFKYIGYSPALLDYLNKIDLESQMDGGCFC
ncbi:MAG: hypothetical protein IPN42_17715 [Methylococcaceae bacterium]|nr:hypothetical protein [Methylococcaceae bacterium]